MKLIVMGYGGHGKDEVCQRLQERYGLTYKSSSITAAELVIYPILKGLMGYKSLWRCHADRVNHRELWYELIKAYNHMDRTRLAREIFNQVDVYCGIRDREEYLATRAAALFDFAIWVDASKRNPPEDDHSCTLNPSDADYVLDNNGPMDDLDEKIRSMMRYLNQIVSRDFVQLPWLN